MNKEIEKAKENLSFMNEGDYITKEMENSARVLEDYIQQLEFNIKASKKEHNHDVAMIDEVKGEAVRLYRVLDKVKELANRVNDEMADFEAISLKHEILNIIEGDEK